MMPIAFYCRCYNGPELAQNLECVWCVHGEIQNLWIAATHAPLNRNARSTSNLVTTPHFVATCASNNKVGAPDSDVKYFPCAPTTLRCRRGCRPCAWHPSGCSAFLPGGSPSFMCVSFMRLHVLDHLEHVPCGNTCLPTRGEYLLDRLSRAMFGNFDNTYVYSSVYDVNASRNIAVGPLWELAQRREASSACPDSRVMPSGLTWRLRASLVY